jgi:hypothetical protein
MSNRIRIRDKRPRPQRALVQSAGTIVERAATIAKVPRADPAAHAHRRAIRSCAARVDRNHANNSKSEHTTAIDILDTTAKTVGALETEPAGGCGY